MRKKIKMYVITDFRSFERTGKKIEAHGIESGSVVPSETEIYTHFS